MEIDAARIAAIPWFAGLEAPLRAALIAGGRVLRRRASEWLYGEGDEDTGLVAVLDGLLHLHVAVAGDRTVLSGVLPAGAVMGQSMLFGGGPRLVTAICAVDSVILALPDRVLRDAATAHPDLWRNLSTLVYAQLRFSVQASAEYAALRPRERLIARLLALSARTPTIALSQSALAELIGASRKAVNGWLAELEADGAVERGYGEVTVRRPEVLERMLAE